MKLLIADDHALFRDALLQYIERAVPEADVLLARDLNEVMEILEGDPVLDLILLDFRMPGMNGLVGLEMVRDKVPDTPVALLSGLAEKGDVEQALAMGAKAYFPKTMSGKLLLKAIQDVIAGDEYVATDHNTNSFMPSYYPSSAAMAGRGGSRAVVGVTDKVKTSKRLTPREREVLTYLLKGASNKEIAKSLELQVVTVKLHVRGICRKLGAKNRTQAALMAHELAIAEGQ